MVKYCRLVIYIFLIFLTSSLSAQYFKGGLLIGITGCQIDGDDMGGYNKPGVAAGFFVSREISYKLKWQAELYYIMKGAAKITTTQDPYMFKTALHYVEMPFLLSYSFSEKLQGQFGPAVAYLWWGTRNNGDGVQELDYQINKYDISAIAGFSYLLNDRFNFAFRISHSITPISHEPGNLTWLGTYGQYNHLLNLSLYYTIK